MVQNLLLRARYSFLIYTSLKINSKQFMKRIAYILGIVLTISIVFTSCENILDLTPQDRLTSQDYFKNEEQLQLYSNQFYADILPGGGGIYADNTDALIISPLDPQISGQRLVPEKGGGWDWGPLRNVNFLLAHSVNCEDEQVREKYNAVARFFRAYFYF